MNKLQFLIDRTNNQLLYIYGEMTPRVINFDTLPPLSTLLAISASSGERSGDQAGAAEVFDHPRSLISDVPMRRGSAEGDNGVTFKAQQGRRKWCQFQ
jgi:hypothetical protein